MDEVVLIQKKLKTKFETSIWAAKLVLLCVGFISTFIFFKVEILPFTYNLILSTFHPLSISLRSWLSPPYIYIILNFIIITIVASTRAHNYHSENIHTVNNGRSWHDIKGEEEELNPSFSLDEYEKFIDDTSKEVCGKDKPVNITTGEGEGEEEEEEEEEALDTIEDTWRLITENKGTRKPELKKSDTWDTPPRPRTRVVVELDSEEEDNDDPVVWARRELRKSDTFNDRVTFIKREIQKSMTQDELTQRVEAFIHKFNKDMRLQREESQQLFMEIMNRGV